MATFQSKMDEKQSLIVPSDTPGAVKLRDPFMEGDDFFKPGTSQAQINSIFLEASNIRKESQKKQNALNTEAKNAQLGLPQESISLKDEGCELYAQFKDVKGQAGVALRSDIAKIFSKWKAMGICGDTCEKLALEIAIHCADSGASPKTQLKGVSKFASGRCFEDLLGVIRDVCTLRSFCAYYAKYVWNIMLSNQQAPSNYIKKGFKEDTKYAAFDFFHGVKSRASKDPPSGLVREPSLAEIIASRTNSMVLISRTTEFRDTNASTEVEITGGRFGPPPKLTVRNFKK
uniref:Capsid protein n=1 Tax=Hibiscus chlorotic speck associated virus 3 TaxID=3143944 RepID=A0AAU7L313_9VIRU